MCRVHVGQQQEGWTARRAAREQLPWAAAAGEPASTPGAPGWQSCCMRAGFATRCAVPAVNVQALPGGTTICRGPPPAALRNASSTGSRAPLLAYTPRAGKGVRE
jgi:hypothetical protein